MWLTVEDDVARDEREVSWHWAWDDGPADGTLRQFAWEFELAESLTVARLTLAAQKGLEGVWLDGQLLHASQDGMIGRELQDLDLGALKAGKHSLTADLCRFRPFVKEPRQGGVGALLHAGENTGCDGGRRLIRRRNHCSRSLSLWFGIEPFVGSAGNGLNRWQHVNANH